MEDHDRAPAPPPAPKGAALPPPPAAPGAAGRDLSRLVSGHRYLILMLLLIGGLVVESVTGRPLWVSLVAELLLGLTLFVMVVVVFEGRRSRYLALWSWLVVTALGWTLYVLPPQTPVWPRGLQLILLAALHGWAAALILQEIFQLRRVGRDAVFGAVTGYILAAGGWGNLYGLCELLAPGSFHVSPELAGQFADPQTRNAMFIYFSMVTITTVGFGDVTPARGPVTVFAMLETVFGQFYFAVVVAQIVGMRLAQGLGGRRDED